MFRIRYELTAEHWFIPLPVTMVRKNIWYCTCYTASGDKKEWYTQGAPHLILDTLIARRKALPMVMVFPNGRAQRDDRPIGQYSIIVQTDVSTTN